MDGMLRRLGFLFALVGLLVALSVTSAGAATWGKDTLDGPAGIASGQTPNTAGQHTSTVLFQSLPHVFYYEVVPAAGLVPATGHLRHAWWNGSAWSAETLDGDATNVASGKIKQNVGGDTSATLFGGLPHVFYYNFSANDLRHGWWDGAAWHFETLDGKTAVPTPNPPTGQTSDDVGQYSSVTLFGGLPHVWYYDNSFKELRHAWWDGVQWSFERLDGNGGSTPNVGQYSSVTLFGGLPHVFYYDASGKKLRHAWWTGVQWSFEALDGPSVPGGNGRSPTGVGQFTSVTLFGGMPHVFYYRASTLTVPNGDLRHAWWDGAQWRFETLDGGGLAGPSVGQYTATTLVDGLPHVWYYDATNGGLRHASWSGLAWVFETVDVATPPGVGQFTSVTLFGGQPHVFYYDAANLDLRHAWLG